jgi:hypothetical protein
MLDKPRPVYGVLNMPSDTRPSDSYATATIIEGYPDHARIIGYIIAEWTQVEFKLIMWLAFCLRLDRMIIKPMLYAIETSRGRLEAMTSAFLVLFKEEPERSEVLAILTEAKSLLNQRNKFAHAAYAKSSTGELAIVKPRTDEAVELPVHDLRHQFERMRALSDRIGQKLRPFFGKLPLTPFAAPATQQNPSGSDSVRIHPSPQEPPPASPE